MSNVLTHPKGPEYQLSVGEGTYVLQDNLHLATPPPHPQDAPVVSSNPLATTPAPPKAGIKLSICIASPRKSHPLLHRVDTSASTKSNLGTYSIKENEKDSRSSHETNSDGATPQFSSSNTSGRTPVFGEDNVHLTPLAGKEGLKRKKPKQSLVKSNSQFISRVIPHDQLSKRLQEHNPEGIFVFANIDRAFQWLDLSSPTPARVSRLSHLLAREILMFPQAQPMMKILFAKAHVLCHDINPFTKGPNHIDVVMGASTGDIVWFEAYSQKYVRINKNVCIYHSFTCRQHVSSIFAEYHIFLSHFFHPLAPRLREPIPCLAHGWYPNRLRQRTRRCSLHPRTKYYPNNQRHQPIQPRPLQSC